MTQITTSSQRKVGIVGGGIGGLTAALALLKRGIDVEVYEQSNLLKEVGAGVQIGSNGTRVLYALGLEDALSRIQVLPARREIRHWRTGETWNWFELGAAKAAVDAAINEFACRRKAVPHTRVCHGRQADRRFLILEHSNFVG